MKRRLNQIKENILIYDFIFIGVNLILSFILYLMNIRFRTWMIIVISFVSVVGFVVGILQQIYKSTESKKVIITISILSFIFMATLIFVSFPFIKIGLLFSYRPEHTVVLDGKKYVAVVRSFLHVDVDYYDYYGPLLMGTKVRVHGDFGEGDFDPFEHPNSADQVEYTYYDKNGKIRAKRMETFIKDKDGKIIDRIKNDISGDDKFNENENYILPEDGEVLYEKKFDQTILRFSKIDNVSGQNMLVHVIKSKDDGESFYVVSEDPIQVSNEAKFVFLSKTLGFAISTGNIDLNNNNQGLMVTNDGGKTFTSANVEYENPDVDYITIEKIPYYEKDSLKMKCSVYQLNSNRDGYDDKEITFISNDNGLHWQLEDENL
ncbi:MAG TPA: hypothetical protein IAD49_02800 [Candidatus Fimihabitans intestinipullorum]|uniref:Uncharacterized protein n=1 Tax=Candidatus Fimihabitans intestinipullorum TaxID=2840820 RepID=A0A9D1L3Y4_9BACT|nr:hypothetical protein [Candidatus Fimihabitans intestinipullorum]